MPQKLWAVGEEVLAADFNTYAQNQVVPQFTNTAQRDSQWASPPAGALCVTVDTNTLWQRVGTGWQRQGTWLAGSQYSTTDAGMFPSTGNLLAVTWTAVASRRYWIHADALFGASSGGGAMTMSLRVDGTDVVAPRNPSWGGTLGLTGPAIAMSAIWTGAAGAHTAAVLGTSSASGLFFQDGTLVVLDVGL